MAFLPPSGWGSPHQVQGVEIVTSSSYGRSYKVTVQRSMHKGWEELWPLLQLTTPGSSAHCQHVASILKVLSLEKMAGRAPAIMSACKGEGSVKGWMRSKSPTPPAESGPSFAKLPSSPTHFCFLSFTITLGTWSL